MSAVQGEEVFSLFGRSKQDPESQPLACSPASWRLSTDGQRWWKERSLEPTCPSALLSVVEPEVYHVVVLPGIPTHFPMSCTCKVSSSWSLIMLNYLIEYVSRKSFPYINNVRQVDPLKRFMVKFFLSFCLLQNFSTITDLTWTFSLVHFCKVVLWSSCPLVDSEGRDGGSQFETSFDTIAHRAASSFAPDLYIEPIIRELHIGALCKPTFQI